ncbi:hypothetical protein [Geminisphaera colitermitum]|uniref:hypothetical protein n=1 Tax=Geminisphaera colitermitum TaxID=1148786 RepID=UPI00019653DC|nr:hypothetical protein [Geminisphaera colitermitum]
MKYLLDVNGLIAWRHTQHPKHVSLHAWAVRTGFKHMGTCAIVELGFLRISMSHYQLTLADARKALADIRKLTGGYIADCPSPALPLWATTAARTTDAYLCQLATAHGLQLATFDTGIKDPVAFLIPPAPDA